MKINKIKVGTLLLSVTLLCSSCIGSFSLFNKLARWNTQVTSNKFLNELIGIILTPAYAFCGLADWLVLNSIEFWTGSNPVAQKTGTVESVMGMDGRYYTLKYLKNGYEITSPEGEVISFLYDWKTKSWSSKQGTDIRELFRFNEDGTVRTSLPDGRQMDVTPDEAGLYQVRMAVGDGVYFATR